MATETQIAQIQMRRDTAANWTSEDPTLANGEWGLETDTKKIKIGDGSTSWSSLDYYIENDKLCTAWVNFNGTGTVAIRDSYNVSSITDNGTGDYTINFDTAMDNTNYVSTPSAGEQGVTLGITQEISKTLSAYRFISVQTSSAGQDSSTCNVLIFGGKA